MEKVNLAIIGSRDFKDYLKAKEVIDAFQEKYQLDFHIISGGAQGADTIAQKYAKEKGLPITIYYPNYNKYGKTAPFVRNRSIIISSDFVLAFWDFESNGTRQALQEAEELNKKIIVYNYLTGGIIKGGSFNES